jgi:hypothetical protein
VKKEREMQAVARFGMTYGNEEPLWYGVLYNSPYKSTTTEERT